MKNSCRSSQPGAFSYAHAGAGQSMARCETVSRAPRSEGLTVEGASVPSIPKLTQPNHHIHRKLYRNSKAVRDDFGDCVLAGEHTDAKASAFGFNHGEIMNHQRAVRKEAGEQKCVHKSGLRPKRIADNRFKVLNLPGYRVYHIAMFQFTLSIQ